MQDFNSKYTGEEVEQLLDQVANGAVGGDTLTDADIAAMGFTKNQGTITEVKMNGVSKGTSGVIDLGDVPTKEEFNDHTELIITLDEDVAILYYDKQDVITDLANIRSGAAKGAKSVQTYIVSFDISNLLSGETIRDIHADELKGAINAHKLILIPIDLSSPTFGYVPMSAWVEGDIYFSVLFDDTIIYGEIAVNNEEIYASDIKIIKPGLKQDTLVSGENIKTINGESILGSGNIEVSGGGSSSGGGDIRYFTEFTVEDFIEACETANIITFDTTELFNAMKSNKVICVPYRGYDKGFIVASYKSGEDEEYPSMYLQKGDVEYYAWTGDSHELSGEYPIYNNVQVVEITEEDIYYGEVRLDVLDNHIYKISAPVDILGIFPSDIQKGVTIHFMSGTYGTTLELSPDMLWANGEIPEIEPNTYYELSIISNAFYNYNAVLTPFKRAE